MKRERTYRNEDFNLTREDEVGVGSKLLPIPNFPGYFASEDGHVYSLRGCSPRTRKLKMLAESFDGLKHYLGVSFRKEGKTYVMGLHRAICSAFHGIPKEGQTASHLNGNRTDNRAENLAWESLKENCARKKAHGTSDDGWRNSRAKFRKEEVEIIRKCLSLGISSAELGIITRTSERLIGKIKRNEHYRL